jgi:hypothetical protein
MEVRALEVRHGLKALLPYGVHLISNREKRDRQCCNSGVAVLAQGGEGDVRHHLNASVGLTADNNHDHGFVGSKGIITLTCTYPSCGPWTADNDILERPRRSQDG